MARATDKTPTAIDDLTSDHRIPVHNAGGEDTAINGSELADLSTDVAAHDAALGGAARVIEGLEVTFASGQISVSPGKYLGLDGRVHTITVPWSKQVAAGAWAAGNSSGTAGGLSGTKGTDEPLYVYLLVKDSDASEELAWDHNDLAAAAAPADHTIGLRLAVGWFDGDDNAVPGKASPIDRRFLLATPDGLNAPFLGTDRLLVDVPAPVGALAEISGTARFNSPSSTEYMTLRETWQTDNLPDGSDHDYRSDVTGYLAVERGLRIDENGQIAARTSNFAAANYVLFLRGWRW